MKKLSKALALTLTSGMLLTACGEADEIEGDLPELENPEEEDLTDEEIEDLEEEGEEEIEENLEDEE